MPEPGSPVKGGDGREAALRIATAVLMLDVAHAEPVFEESDFYRVLELVESHFQLDSETAAELVIRAEGKTEDLVSLHEFTRLLHRYLEEREKARIVELLRKIAYAHGRLDNHEESLVTKISDLTYVSRGRAMRLKHDAERAAGQEPSIGHGTF